MKYIIQAADSHDRSRAGNKASSLASLLSGGFPVPDWFVIPPGTFFEGLSDKDKKKYRHLQTLDPIAEEDLQSMQELIDKFAACQDLVNEVSQSISSLSSTLFAVRSSGLDEDGSKHSFAGQMESFLFVPVCDILSRMKDVWRSAFAPRIIAYRKERGLTPLPTVPAVIVQQMISPEVSGVVFSRYSAAGQRGCLIGAVYGLGQSLVSGEADGDTYVVGNGGTEQHIVKKPAALRLDVEKGHGTALTTVDELSARKATLCHEQIEAVAALARKAEHLFGSAQDVEWAIADGTLYILQSRPITSINNQDKGLQGELRIFDNSNIGESYSGVTTPLTFTFARHAYQAVYRQFLMLMQVPEHKLAANEHVLSNMIACVHGRIYYNLINWYRVLAMLPGYTINRSFMEQMMGVKKALPDEVTIGQECKTTSMHLLADGLAAVLSLCGLLVNYVLLTRTISSFYKRLNGALKPVVLTDMTLDNLAAYYRKLEAELLRKWDAPLINDFFAMICYGVLCKLTVAWCKDTNGSLQNDLLSDTGNIISAEPAKRIKQMARLAAENEELTMLLLNESQAEVVRHIPRWPEFKLRYEEYMVKFEDRCLGELKLESQTLSDDALPLLRSIGQMSQRIRAGERPSRRTTRLIRRRAEKRAYQAIGRSWLRRALFAFVLHNARTTIRNRENLRFERTRVFGRVRQIFLQIGRLLTAQQLLADSRDIFYLQLDDIMNYIDATNTSGSLKDLVQLHKRKFNLYSLEKEPNNRIEVRGQLDISMAPDVLPGPASVAASKQSQVTGLGCSPGTVRGRVRLVVDPKEAVLQPGDILVAKRTDPGWITLFPAAAGLLVQHGSLLSHVAIVARELGLPAIVSIPGLTDVLQNGDFVELDGTTGIVRRLDQPVAPQPAQCEVI